MIKLNNIQCRALHINLWIDHGKHHLLAPNGGGKTTLFKLLTGQLKPSFGNLSINELSPSKKHYKQQFGFCPDALNFWPFASVQNYIDLHLQAYGLTELSDDAKWLKQRFQLPNFAIEQLSLGQTKQLLILCCVTSPASWLLFDEPLNGLDIQAREVFMQWLEQTPKSVLISSHIDLPSFNKITLRGSDELCSAST